MCRHSVSCQILLVSIKYSKPIMSIRTAVLGRVQAAYMLFAKDSLFRNATFLMASTAVMSVLGFVFWVFVAHLYTPTDIGIASTLISITSLISNLSLLGLNSGIIRFLAGSKKPSQDINAAAIIVTCVTLLAAAAYILVSTALDGGTSLLDGTWPKVAFIVLMTSVSLNSLTDAVFISNRRGEYHTIGYATFAIVKLLLPLVFVPFGATGIFGAYILAMIASLAVSYYLMHRGCNYHLLTMPDWKLLKQMRGYTFHNYIGVVLAGLPAQLMPLLIIRDLGAASVAFFSMAWTMANLLYIIPSAVTQSLLAESSYDARQLARHLKRTVRLLSLLLIPAITVAILVSPHLLAIFGPQYRQNGTVIFQILALGTLFMAVSSVGNTLLNIERRTWGIVGVQVVTVTTTAVAALVFIRFGLIGVGLAFLAGNIAASLTHLWLRITARPRRTPDVAFPALHTDLRAMLAAYKIADFSMTVFGNGSSNRTLLIHASNNQYVLRIYKPSTCTDTQIEREIDFISYLASQGLPTPHILTNTDGTQLSHLELNGIRWQYVLMEFMAGKHPASYTPELLQDMALQQAQLHLSGVAYAKQTADQHPSPRTRERLLTTFTASGYSHFDYDATNLLVNDGHISAILDFEGMRYGSLVACVYFTLSRIYEFHQDPTLLICYLASYQQLRQLRPLEKLILSTSLSARYRKPSLLRLLRA